MVMKKRGRGQRACHGRVSACSCITSLFRGVSVVKSLVRIIVVFAVVFQSGGLCVGANCPRQLSSLWGTFTAVSNLVDSVVASSLPFGMQITAPLGTDNADHQVQPAVMTAGAVKSFRACAMTSFSGACMPAGIGYSDPGASTGVPPGQALPLIFFLSFLLFMIILSLTNLPGAAVCTSYVHGKTRRNLSPGFSFWTIQ